MSKFTIFDIGAFDGLEGICLALVNPNAIVYAFEANPEMIEKILLNKRKIQKLFLTKLNNYKIFNYAVSNRSGVKKNFYIAKNPTVSSLYKFNQNLEAYYPGFKNPHFTTIKKIKISTIKLKDFIVKKKINSIEMIKIDTQGNDFNVLKGLKEKISIVNEGILEISCEKKSMIYKKKFETKNIFNFLKKNGFLISKIKLIKSAKYNEADIYFNKKNTTSYIYKYYNSSVIRRLINKEHNFLDFLYFLYFFFLNVFLVKKFKF